jgi:hypothetical protein
MRGEGIFQLAYFAGVRFPYFYQPFFGFNSRPTFHRLLSFFRLPCQGIRSPPYLRFDLILYVPLLRPCIGKKRPRFFFDGQ